jgi:hypothetical protein
MGTVFGDAKMTTALLSIRLTHLPQDFVAASRWRRLSWRWLGKEGEVVMS